MHAREREREREREKERERERYAVIQSLVTSVPMRPGIGGTAGLKRRFFKDMPIRFARVVLYQGFDSKMTPLGRVYTRT